MVINCYNKETEKEVKKQFRDSKGRFSKSKALIYLFLIIAILETTYIGTHWKVKEIEKIVKVDTVNEIIDRSKTEVLDLLEKCESNNKESEIVWEDYGVGKNRASFGAYMLKIGTIQQYRKELNDFQAIALASNREQSRQLSSEIIFEHNGIGNWKNCMIKNDLLTKVNFINQLIKKNENI